MMRSFIICTVHKILEKSNQEACSMHRGMRNTNFFVEVPEGKNHFRGLDEDVSILLKCVLKKWSEKAGLN